MNPRVLSLCGALGLLLAYILAFLFFRPLLAPRVHPAFITAGLNVLGILIGLQVLVVHFKWRALRDEREDGGRRRD